MDRYVELLALFDQHGQLDMAPIEKQYLAISAHCDRLRTAGQRLCEAVRSGDTDRITDAITGWQHTINN